MKTNIHKVNYDGTPNTNGNWWVWRETCDRCQKLIYDETTQHSDFEEADVDFCAECIRYFMKKHISYKEAEMKYTKEEFAKDGVYYKTNRSYWSIINGEKHYYCGENDSGYAIWKDLEQLKEENDDSLLEVRRIQK